jgi:hypothetical protein
MYLTRDESSDSGSNPTSSEGGSDSDGEIIANASESELDCALEGKVIPDGFWAWVTADVAQPGTAALDAARIAAKRAVVMLNLLIGTDLPSTHGPPVPLPMPSNPEEAGWLRVGIAIAAAKMGADQFISAQKRDSQGEANDAADQNRTDEINYRRLVYSTITEWQRLSATRHE